MTVPWSTTQKSLIEPGARRTGVTPFFSSRSNRAVNVGVSSEGSNRYILALDHSKATSHSCFRGEILIGRSIGGSIRRKSAKRISSHHHERSVDRPVGRHDVG